MRPKAARDRATRLDGRAREVAEVSVGRLRAGHCQEDAGQAARAGGPLSRGLG